MHEGGAPSGNQNARRHGWTSAKHPVPIEEILAAADTAAAKGDLDVMRKAVRALHWHGEHESARLVEAQIEAIRFQRRQDRNAAGGSSEITKFAPSDTESDQNNSARQIVHENGHRPATPPQNRTARGYRRI
jgi:hypothetical protein